MLRHAFVYICIYGIVHACLWPHFKDTLFGRRTSNWKKKKMLLKIQIFSFCTTELFIVSYPFRCKFMVFMSIGLLLKKYSTAWQHTTTYDKYTCTYVYTRPVPFSFCYIFHYILSKLGGIAMISAWMLILSS